jgi:hypothetical protein
MQTKDRDAWAEHIQALLYPVQFEDEPVSRARPNFLLAELGAG